MSTVHWSPAEIEAAVDAYSAVFERRNRGEVVPLRPVFEALASQYGRSTSAYQYRFRNISHVLAVMGLAWLPGQPPAEHVGPTAEATIRQVIEAKNYFGEELVEPTADPAQLERRTRALLLRGVPSAPLGRKEPQRVTTSVERFVRDPAVKAAVLEAAVGNCENCGQPAPFVQEDGTPFLEVHHVKWLAQGGSDTVTNAVAICPNCHRQFHYGIDKEHLATSLIGRIARLVSES
ncbi:HNH endonuclease [Hymenobacter convexus]|uniref:HNH endonuclease n=1 Tax=Hymenobacter sp. CA1UV-4 TaxID=3063782 RepID=UPI0027131FDB|nr:HNH endonuclease signature motif containing protein [Hymenobacter sp. CA1UV-4]MDO7853191.1 HNH endonuclease signature motif containing protein [Hymenobacter sp. CA1UV-4]